MYLILFSDGIAYSKTTVNIIVFSNEICLRNHIICKFSKYILFLKIVILKSIYKKHKF